MAYGLDNPNDRRRINLISRWSHKTKTSPQKAVALWLAEKDIPSAQRTISRTAMYGPSHTSEYPQGGARGASFRAAGGLAALPKQSKDQKKASAKAYAKTKRAVATAFRTQDPAGYKRGYNKAVLGGQGRRYLKKSKKQLKAGTGFMAGKEFYVTNKAEIEKWDATRLSRRAAGEWGHTLPFVPKPGRYARGQNVKFTDVYQQVGTTAKGQAKYGLIGGVQSASSPETQMSLKQLRAMHPGIKAKSKAAFLAKLRESGAMSNPFFGDLALTNGLALSNPSFGGAGSYLGGYALPVMVAGAAAGGLTAMASTQGWTESIADMVAKIPVAGEFAADNMPYSIQGVLVGTTLAVVAAKVGGEAGKYLALTGGAALVFGAGIDAFNFMTGGEEEDDFAIEEEDYEMPEEGEEELAGLAFGDLALENTSALGDLALENMGGFALDNGGSFHGGSLTQEYGQSGYGDAFYSGADFSGEEGQALLNGRHSYFKRFGTPPYRPAKVAATVASHLAGRRGHRWGWLIRTVGWEKARQICALAPKSRVKVIHQLRQAAIATYQQLISEAQAVQAETQSADPEFAAIANAPTGATGAQNYLGDPALFMGA